MINMFETVVGQIKEMIGDMYTQEITEDTKLEQDLGFNSLNYLNLLVRMEDNVAIDIMEASEYVKEMITVKDAVRIFELLGK